MIIMLRTALCRLPRTPLTHSTKSESTTLTQRCVKYQQARWLNVSPSCLQYERSRYRRKEDDQDAAIKKKTTYSNRQFVKLEGADERPNRHLYTLPRDVFGTSDRVAQLLVLYGVDKALEFLTHLPLNLQSTVVWNQLLNHCAKGGKSSMVESIFSQMRKRGFAPSERTFAHILTTFINSDSPEAVKRAESWIERMEDYDIQPTTYHYNTLLNVYKKANCNNQIMAKVRQMMRDDDLLPYPDHVTLSTALQICPLLINSQDKEIKRIWQYIIDSFESDNGVQQQQQQQRMDRPTSLLQAKVLQLQSTDPTWRYDQEAIQEKRQALQPKVKFTREPIQVDDTLVVALIRALSRSNGKQTGGINTQFEMVMDIMNRLYGLRPSKDSIDDKDDFGLTPGVTVLDAMVRYCGAVRQFALGEAYFDLALQKFPGLEPDDQAYSAYAWMQSHTRRKNWIRKNRNNNST
ncbi:hypothetical protein BC941DRAFT_504443 [Chlamydoabsidia padenii]|nr:hypothetical protein BC941DRAFT_504443 [Chlamydoabsidia padenii]